MCVCARAHVYVCVMEQATSNHPLHYKLHVAFQHQAGLEWPSRSRAIAGAAIIVFGGTIHVTAAARLAIAVIAMPFYTRICVQTIIYHLNKKSYETKWTAGRKPPLLSTLSTDHKS